MTCNLSYCVAFLYCTVAQICLVYAQYSNKSSLSFVIDESNLMLNETEHVKSSIDSILETVRISTASQIQHFVLVTFDDPEYTLHIVTENMDTFKNGASKVYVRDDNPQYPENVTTGIKVAIENSLPYSIVYVFTNASAKHSEMFEEVKRMAQKKQIQVTFMVTGECGSGENSRCKLHNQLAAATKGEVLNLMKSNITDILEYVKENTKSRSDIIASKKFPPGYGHKLEFFVPTEMDELIISVNGLKPKIEVTDSEGNKVDIGWLKLKYEIAIIKVTDLSLGVYTADVGSTSDTHVKIMGNSTVHFTFGFSPFETSSLSDTAASPALDGDAYSSLKLQGEGVKLEAVQIIDMDGTILEELPLRLNNDKEGLYVNKSFHPLNVPFQLSVSGSIKKNINRTSLTPIGRQSEKFAAPIIQNLYAVKTYTCVKGDLGLRIQCNPTGYPKPLILWKKDGLDMASGSKWFDIEEGALIIKNIEESQQGTYTCIARNKIGYDISVYTVNVNDYPIIPEIKASMIIDPDTSFDVPCDIKHNNTDFIRWYKDSRIIAYGKLTLKNVSSRDSGIYSCRVGDMWESSSSHVEIKIGYGPYFYTKETEIITFKEGKKYHLICSAKGVPEPKVTWAYNGKTLGISSMIHTIEMALSKRGNYTCKISNSYGSIERSFRIIPQVPPRIEKPKFSTIDLLVGTALILQCNADGYPEPQIKWFFQEFDTKATPRTLRSNVTTKGLNLSRVQLRNQGNYTCEASNVGGKTNITYTVYVNAAPSIENLYAVKLFTCVRGDLGLRIQCKATGYPKPLIVWKKDDLDIVTGSKWFDIEEGALIIKNIEKSQEGTYTCLASNKIGNDSSVYTVNVNDYPIIPKIESSMIIDPGASIDVPCDIKHNNTDSIRWYKDSRLIAYGKLTLKNVSPRDSGIYSCRVGDMWESSSSHVEIQIGYGPYFYTKETEIILFKQGKFYHFICSAKGLPEPKITWAYNGKTLDISSMIHTIEMTLNNRGNYTCEISNSYGSIERSFRIIPQVPPRIEKPKSSTIDILVGTDLILQCNADGYPVPQIEWLFQEFDTKATPRTLRSNVTTKGLYLSYIQIRDQGNYTCEASNVGGKTNITYTVYVNAAPIMQNLYAVKTFTCLKGDLGLRIQCNATGYPKPSIIWIKDGLDIVPGSKWFDIEEGALIIKNIEKSQEGTYTCLASNKIGNDSSVYTVNVNDYPIIPKIESSMIIDPDTSFDVPCDIKYNNTDFIRWYKDSRLIAYGKLSLKNISPRDSGIYSCRVGDMWESKSSHVEIKIGYGPYFYTKETKLIPFKEGKKYHLICSAKGLPEPKITWAYNGKTLGISSMIHTIQMTLSNRGNYTCKISNSYGSIERSFRIISQECIFDIKKGFLHKNQPMMLSLYMTWPTFTIDDGYIVLGKGESFLLYCPNKFVRFNTSYITADCVGATQIRITDNIYEHSEIECHQEIKPEIIKSKKRCLLGKGVKVKVGCKMFYKFLDVYEVCLDTYKNVPLYTRHVLTPNQYNVSTTKNVWWLTYLSPYNFTTIYNCKNQVHYISSILEDPFHYNDECCFGKRQLVSPMDFTPGIPETTAHTYLNVVPHWSTCNSKNWAEIEQKVRNLAKLLNRKLTVLTGTAEPLVMKGRRGSKEITIHDDRNNNLPVAQYLWKVVQDPSTKSSLAIIQINVPDLSPKDIPLQIRCRDICEKIEWMKGINWQNMASGYTYCCSIDDFEKAFNYGREFSRGNTKVLNITNII